jgi:hypothetical protein
MNIIIQTHKWERWNKQHFWESVEEAYYLVEEMLYSSVFPSGVVPEATVTWTFSPTHPTNVGMAAEKLYSSTFKLCNLQGQLRGGITVVSQFFQVEKN